MITENSKVILSGFRAIGLKNADIEKFAKVQESSFTVKEEPTVSVPETQVVSEPQPSVVSQVTPEPQVSTEIPVSPQPVEVEETSIQQNINPQVQTPVDAQDDEVQKVPNIFDMPAPEVAPVEPTPSPAPISNESAFDTPVMSEPMPATPQPEQSLDTPTEFFAKEEAPILNSSSEDPALIYLDSIEEIVRNTREIIESKNKMISALNQKVEVLTEELNKVKMVNQNTSQVEMGGQRVLTPNQNIYNQAA